MSYLRNMPPRMQNGPAPCYYRFDIPPSATKGPLSVELNAKNGDVWVTTIPYSRWCRKKSLFFAADMNGLPLKSMQFSNPSPGRKKRRGPARRGYIPYPGFTKAERKQHVNVG